MFDRIIASQNRKEDAQSVIKELIIRSTLNVNCQHPSSVVGGLIFVAGFVTPLIVSLYQTCISSKPDHHRSKYSNEMQRRKYQRRGINQREYVASYGKFLYTGCLNQ